MRKYLLAFLLLFSAPVFAAQPITESIVGRPIPPRLSLEYLRYAAELQYLATTVTAPITRGTVYYFSTTGADGNSGLSSGSPKQNISELNTVLAASGGNITILLKCGDVWDVTSGINGDATDDNITIASYGTGARPLLNGFTSKIASGSAWTVGTGSRYTATAAADMGDFREVNNRDFQYRRVASTAEVESTPFSYYWAAGTVHCNANGVDPDTITGGYEYTLAGTTDDSGIYIPNGATGYRIDGIQCDGWGADGGAVNQEYGIKFAGIGTDTCVVTNCKATRSARHNLGHNGGANSGGFMLVANCEAGMDTEVGAAPYVFYQQNGGQEIWMFSNSTPWGAQPLTATRNYADGLAVICHTNSTSTPPGFAHVQDHQIPANSQGFGCHNSIALDNFAVQTNPNLCEAVVIGTRMEKAVGTSSNGSASGFAIARQGTVEIGSYYDFIPLNSPTDAMGSFDPRGHVYNTDFRVDLTNAGMTEGWFAFYNPTAATNDPKIHGCFFEIISNGTTDFGLNYDLNFIGATSITAGYATGSELFSSVWSVKRKYPGSTADGIKPALPNSSAVLRNNAYWNVSADDTYVGISSTSNPVYLTHAPIFGVTPAQGSPLVNTGRGGEIPYDFYSLARNVVTPTIGARELRTRMLIDPTASEMAQQIWALDTAQLTVASSVGERVKRLPNADPATNGGLPTVNASNYVAGIQGTINTLDGLDTAQDTQHATTQGFIDTEVTAIKTKTDFLPSATAGAAGGVFIAGTNAATTVTTAFTTTFTGNLTGSVGSVGANGISASSIATGAITNTKFAANAVDAAALATDAVTEIQSGLATAANLATVDGIIDNMYTAFELDTAVYRLTTNALEQAPTGGGASAATIADAVWDEVLSGHLTAGTTGKALSDILSGGGGGGLDAAGVRAALGMASANLDTQLAAIDDYIDTEVGAIKTKTDFLPSATAGAAGGLFIAGTNAATTVTTSFTTTFTGNLTGSVGSVTGAVGSVTGNVGGNVTGSVGSVAANGIAATSIATGAITNTKFAANALDAAALATDAVTEIQSGLATATALNTVDDFVDTEITALTGAVASVQSDTTNLMTRLSAARAGYLDNLNVGGSVATASSVAIMDGILDNIFTGMELDGAVYRWTTNALEQAPVSGGGGLDAAGVRAAIGLASANLDDQLSSNFNLVASVDDNVNTVLNRLTETRAGYLDVLPLVTDMSTIVNKLDTTFEVDGINWRFTEDALFLAPGGGGAGGDENKILQTTIASVVDASTFTLAAGSNLTSAYVRQTLVIEDESNNDYPTIRTVDQYVGSTKTVVLASPAGFMPAVGDTVKIFIAPDSLSGGTGGDTVIQNTEEVRP